MPELPEVETVKNFLDLHLLKSKILWVKIENKMLRYEIPPQICKTLINNRITKIIRRGKYLIFLLNNQSAVLCHLGMTGCFRISRDYVKRKHDHFIMGLKNKQIIFNDINGRIDFLENTLNQAGSISEKFSIEKQLMLKNKISDLKQKGRLIIKTKFSSSFQKY